MGWKKCLVAFVLMVVFVLIYCFITSLPTYAHIEGEYLKNGIFSVFMIKAGIFTYSVKEEASFGISGIVKIINKSDYIILLGKDEDPSIKSCRVYKLIPSSLIKGDWDLVGESYMENMTTENEAIKHIQDFKKPLFSYLHRIEDNRIKNYIITPNISIARELLKDHPDDPYVQVIYLDALMRSEKWDELAEKNARWSSNIENNPNPIIAHTTRLGAQAVEYNRLAKEGRNAYEILIGKLGERQVINEALLEKIYQAKGSVSPVSLPSMGIGATPIPSFPSVQVAAKVILTDAVFAMIKGDNARALHLLVLDYRLSQILCGRTFLISNLIGIAVKAVTCNGMDLYMANACRTPEEVKEFFDTLTRLREVDTSLHWDDFKYMEGIGANPEFATDSVGANLSETRARWNVSETKPRLLLAGAAARYHFLTTGKFPGSPEQFAPLLPNGLPQDPFTTTTLRLISGKDSFVVYSVGPDAKDDAASLVYDPTNGTVSAGDIFLQIPQKPRYPFPPRGQLATKKEDILKQFPNNLPPDIFHNTKGAPLSITDTVPAKIISFGPDTDSARVKDGAGLLPLDPPYDPTNGNISNGDLILDTAQP